MTEQEIKEQEIKENAVPKMTLDEVKEKYEQPGVVISEATGQPSEEEIKAQQEAQHTAMWAALDGKNPFEEWPEQARNLYQSGCQCSLWGRSVTDMTQEQLILFVSYVDTIASDMRNQLNSAYEMMNSVAAKMAAAEKADGEDSLPGAGVNSEGES